MLSTTFDHARKNVLWAPGWLELLSAYWAIPGRRRTRLTGRSPSWSAPPIVHGAGGDLRPGTFGSGTRERRRVDEEISATRHAGFAVWQRDVHCDSGVPINYQAGPESIRNVVTSSLLSQTKD